MLQIKKQQQIKQNEICFVCDSWFAGENDQLTRDISLDVIEFEEVDEAGFCFANHRILALVESDHQMISLSSVCMCGIRTDVFYHDDQTKLYIYI